MLYVAMLVRAALYFVAWFSVKTLPPEWSADNMFIGSWTQWDAGYYIAIADLGYEHMVERGVAFFPLYPMLMKIIATIFLVSAASSGMIISLTSFLISVPLFAILARELLGEDRARTASLLVILNPFAVFYTSVYTESLFLLLCVSALLLARREKWWLAAIVVALATATRVTGLALIPAVLWVAWRRTRSFPLLMGICVIAPLGVFAYMGYLWRSFGNPLKFLSVQREWGGAGDRWGLVTDVILNRPGDVISGEHIHMLALINLVMFVASIALLPVMARKLPPGITIFTALVILQGATSLQSLGRYLLPAVGVYLALAILLEGSDLRRTLRDGLIAVSTVLLTLHTILHVQGKWVI
jgi:hypothetical protein